MSNLDRETSEISILVELNERLLDANQNLLLRLVALSRKSGLPIDVETMGLVATVRKTLHQIHEPPTIPRQPNETTEGSTKYKDTSVVRF
jgi:hypothetical protein